MLDKPGQKGCAVDFGGEPGGMVCSVGGGIEGKSIQARVRGRVKSIQAKWSKLRIQKDPSQVTTTKTTKTQKTTPTLKQKKVVLLQLFFIFNLLVNQKRWEKNTELSDTCSIYTEIDYQTACIQVSRQSDNLFRSITLLHRLY